MDAPFSLGRVRARGRKRASKPLEVHCKATRNLPPIRSSYIVRTEHDDTFMGPFLSLTRTMYPSDVFGYCMQHLLAIESTPLKLGQLDPGFTGNFTPWTRDEKSLGIIHDCLMRNQEFRWRMRQLILRWRIAKCQQMNTEDIFTCEVPQKLVTIYDWKQRTKYMFEATTVYRDISSKLRHATGLFVGPLVPKNPFTNGELTYGQIHFAVEALIRHGFHNWILDAFKKCEYNTIRLLEFYEYPLKHDNLVRLFHTPTDLETVELVYDCICEEYIHHAVVLPYRIGWRLALESRPNMPLIQKWRGLALRREKLLCRYEDGEYLRYRLQEIHRDSYDLIISSVKEIGNIYREHLNKNQPTTNTTRNTNIGPTLVPTARYSDIFTFTDWYNYLSGPLPIVPTLNLSFLLNGQPVYDDEDPLEGENDLADIVIDED